MSPLPSNDDYLWTGRSLLVYDSYLNDSCSLTR
jgi:hypothetical protein